MPMGPANPQPTMTGFDKEAWAGRITTQEDIRSPYAPPPGSRRNGEDGAIAKLLADNPIAFAIGAAVLAFIAVRALK